MVAGDSAELPEEPPERFEHFIERRRLEAAHQRQLRVYQIGLVCLGLACLVLAGSNIMLALRLSAGGPVTAASRAQSTEPSPALPRGASPEPPSPTARPNAEEPPGTPAVDPDEDGRPAPVASQPELPERRRARLELGGRERVDRTATVSEPVTRVAAWMVDVYGPQVAAERAEAAAAFYGAHDPEGRYWRRVVAAIRSHSSR